MLFWLSIVVICDIFGSELSLQIRMLALFLMSTVREGSVVPRLKASSFRAAANSMEMKIIITD